MCFLRDLTTTIEINRLTENNKHVHFITESLMRGEETGSKIAIFKNNKNVQKFLFTFFLRTALNSERV